MRTLIVAALMTLGCTESEPSAVTTSTEATTDPNTLAEGSTSSPAATTAGSSTTAALNPLPAEEFEVISFPVPAGSRPHDVAPADDGGVWYTAQGSGALGHLNPRSFRQ